MFRHQCNGCKERIYLGNYCQECERRQFYATEYRKIQRKQLKSEFQKLKHPDPYSAGYKVGRAGARMFAPALIYPEQEREWILGWQDGHGDRE